MSSSNTPTLPSNPPPVTASSRWGPRLPSSFIQQQQQQQQQSHSQPSPSQQDSYSNSRISSSSSPSADPRFVASSATARPQHLENPQGPPENNNHPDYCKSTNNNNNNYYAPDNEHNKSGLFSQQPSDQNVAPKPPPPPTRPIPRGNPANPDGKDPLYGKAITDPAEIFKDFQWIEEVEWGPGLDSPDFDVDQDLAAKPRRERPSDPCGCQAPEEFYDEYLEAIKEAQKKRKRSGKADGSDSDENHTSQNHENEDDSEVEIIEKEEEEEEEKSEPEEEEKESEDEKSSDEEEDPFADSDDEDVIKSRKEKEKRHAARAKRRADKAKRRAEKEKLKAEKQAEKERKKREKEERMKRIKERKGALPPPVCCLDDSCVLYACREECRSNCEAGEACGNKRLQNRQFKKLEVFHAGLKGRGLRLLEPAKPGDLISEYVGQAVHANQLTKLFRRYHHERRLYIMALGDGVYLDARQKGGLARFINHSCDPNCKVERWKVRGILRAAVIALKPIEAGEELTFDYQWERKRGRAPTKCHCGAATCRQTIEVPKSMDDEKAPEGEWTKLTMKNPDHTLINRTVQVYSKERGEYFMGEITGYDANRKLHNILYRHDINEVWEDLSKLDVMILDEELEGESKDQEGGFTIAKKIAISALPSAGGIPNKRQRVSPVPSSSGSFNSSPPPYLTGGAATQNTHNRPKPYIYVQTPIKEAFWARRLIERCERNCQVQITAHQHARPPLPMDPSNPEDVEKYAALDQSHDGTVWKLHINGSNVSRALNILERNVAYLEKKLAESSGGAISGGPIGMNGPLSSTSAAIASAVSSMAGNRGSAIDLSTSTEFSEVICPRMIVDGVKRKLPSIREKCRNVIINFVPSDSKTKQFSRLTLEANLKSDMAAAQDHLWTVLVQLCEEARTPMTTHKIPRDLGFLGGVISNEQFKLLCSDALNGKDLFSKNQQAGDELVHKSPFFQSFEVTYRCSVWVQSEDDRGRISSTNHIVYQAALPNAPNAPRKVYIGCDPKEVSTRWSQICTRAQDMVRGVKFLYLGADRIFQPLIMKNSGQLFDFVKSITGATVSVDATTGDHLKIDGRASSFHAQLPGLSGVDLVPEIPDRVQKMTEKERASLAKEILRLQIEVFRDMCIRDHSWIFGRDWTLASHKLSSKQMQSTSTPNSKLSAIGAFGQLDSRTIPQCGMEIADVTAHLPLEKCVAVHAAIIFYRFVSVMDETQMKAREAVLACVFLANKCQKIHKWKKIESVLEAGYNTFYPGTQFDPTKEEVVVLMEKVLQAEREILRCLEYDIFMRDIDRIVDAATAGSIMDARMAREALDVAFSGQVLAAGAEIWLKYGVDYVFAVAAAFLKANLTELLPALSLIPLKVSQAAELLVETAKLGKPNSKVMPSHPLVEGGKARLEKYLPRIKEACVAAMKSSFGPLPPAVTVISSLEQRYKIISETARCRHIIAGVRGDVVKTTILPILDGISAESSCNIFIAVGNLPGTEDLILDGPWRAIAIAEHLLQEGTRSITDLPKSVQASVHSKDRPKLQVKVMPGLLDANEVQTLTGWEGTIQPYNANNASGVKVGGKFCVPAKVSDRTLRESGLRWWVPSKYVPGLTGSIHELFHIRAADPSEHLEIVGTLAKTFGEQSFPILSTCAGKKPFGQSERSVAVSLHPWPPDKVSYKEEKGKKEKDMPNQMGASAAALQEMQLLTKLHSLIPSPQGHPNFIIPISIALPGDEESNESETKQSDLLNLDDPMFSLLRSSEENERTAKKEKKVKGFPHLVFHPTPFVLQRFLSRKHRGNEEPFFGPTVLSAWVHDLLSALIHCHSNNIVLRNIQADQIVVDQSGIAKFSCLYRATILSEDERSKPISSLKFSKSTKKKDDEEDFSSKSSFAAPELLLGSQRYTKETDIWAMGCLLANLLLTKPLIVGKDRSSLLTAQYKIVGTPSTDNFEDGKRSPFYVKMSRKYKRGVERALTHLMKRELLPSTSKDEEHAKLEDSPQHLVNNELAQYAKLMDLIAQMLHLDPQKRCTASQALSHEYVVEYIEHSRSPEFRQRYVAEWTKMKEKVSQALSDAEREGLELERNMKRKAMLMAAADDEDGDDDLYDMGDILGDEAASNKKAKDDELDF